MIKRHYRAALLLGSLLLVGCGDVEAPPQGKHPGAQPPPAVEFEQSPPGAGTPHAIRPQVTPPPADRADTTCPADVVKDAAAHEQERIDTNTPALVKTTEPDGAEPAEPNTTRRIPLNPVAQPPPAVEFEQSPPGAGGDPKREQNAFEGPVPQAAAAPVGLAQLYEKYTAFLKAYVREDERVDYASLNRRRLELKDLLTTLAELDPNAYQAWPREEKLAFWVNAYNLKMLEIITRNYPIQSSRWLRLTWPPSDIRHIRGIWTDYKFIVMDEEFTLATVEQQYFAKAFGDPRVYLALTYAARSGPPLRREPYRGAGLDRQLDEQVRRFLSGPPGLQIDRRNMVVRLSAILKPSWHGKEFLARYATDKKFKDRDPQTRAVLSFLTNYLSREDVDFLEVENYTIEYANFDWRVNDAPGS